MTSADTQTWTVHDVAGEVHFDIHVHIPTLLSGTERDYPGNLQALLNEKMLTAGARPHSWLVVDAATGANLGNSKALVAFLFQNVRPHEVWVADVVAVENGDVFMGHVRSPGSSRVTTVLTKGTPTVEELSAIVGKTMGFPGGRADLFVHGSPATDGSDLTDVVAKAPRAAAAAAAATATGGRRRGKARGATRSRSAARTARTAQTARSGRSGRSRGRSRNRKVARTRSAKRRRSGSRSNPKK